MSGTLRTLLGARAAAVVGRQAERAVLLELAERDRPLVVAVHGIAGIGKTALLAAFAEDARAHGAAVVGLDCGGIEPTERGFLAALDRAIGALRAAPPGGTWPMATVAEAAAALSGLGDRVVLVLDSYEQLLLLDTWLRQKLVPGLRDNTRLALAGREPPVAAWISDFGDLLVMVPLANLAAADADALLRREGLSGADAARVTRWHCGWPPPRGAPARTSRSPTPRSPLSSPNSPASTFPASTSQPGPCSTPPARCAGRPCRSSVPCCRTYPRTTPTTCCARCRSWSSDRTAWSCTTPCAKSSRRCCGSTIRRPTAPTGSRPGGNCGASCAPPRLQTCGATPPTCSTSSRTRPSGRRSSPPPATGTRSSQRGRPMTTRSPPSPARTSQPGQSP